MNIFQTMANIKVTVGEKVYLDIPREAGISPGPSKSSAPVAASKTAVTTASEGSKKSAPKTQDQAKVIPTVPNSTRKPDWFEEEIMRYGKKLSPQTLQKTIDASDWKSDGNFEPLIMFTKMIVYKCAHYCLSRLDQ